jgi:hypothetical protein
MSKVKIWTIIIASGLIASLSTASIFYPAYGILLNSITIAITTVVAIATGYELRNQTA